MALTAAIIRRLAVKKKIIIGIIGLIFIIGTMGACSDSGNENSQNNQTDDSSHVEETKETIYEANSTINDFVVSFNERYPDMALSSDDLTVYNHHGQDHENQVWTKFGEDRVLISEEGFGGISVYYEAYQENDTLQEFPDANKRVFSVVMPVLNPDLDDSAVEQRWQDVLDDTINSPEWEDGISFSAGTKRDFDTPASLEYFKIEKR